MQLLLMVRTDTAQVRHVVLCIDSGRIFVKKSVRYFVWLTGILWCFIVHELVFVLTSNCWIELSLYNDYC